MRNVKAELDLSFYSTKSDLKMVIGVDIAKSAKSVDLATIIFVIFLELLMFLQIFLSPQVTRCAIITYKHGI